ncbi:MAG: hypothetical protein DWI07_00605 [Planctomycetota bacterium]|nr:MAG: hypothetical protein DWI07_00605 [Planctomycetota bacterium]
MSVLPVETKILVWRTVGAIKMAQKPLFSKGFRVLKLFGIFSNKLHPAALPDQMRQLQGGQMAPNCPIRTDFKWQSRENK